MSNKPAAPAKPPVIRSTGNSGYSGIELTRLLPAWIVSAVMHIVIILLFVGLGLFGSQKPGQGLASHGQPGPDER